MLSRVADRLYWMARYIERAENTARMINVHSMLMLDLPRGVGIQWSQLLEVSGSDELFHSRYRTAGEFNVLKFIAADPSNPGSLLCTLSMARENVRTTRDQIPVEAWQAINELYLYGRRRLTSPTMHKNRHRIMSEIIARCQRTTGLLSGAMSHGPGYQFVRIGRNIERADMTSRIVDVGSATLVAEGDERKRLANRLWMNVLNALSAHQM
ncbi:alpha-E domain-containing protein, partial [Pseudomonadota bacterium]